MDKKIEDVLMPLTEEDKPSDNISELVLMPLTEEDKPSDNISELVLDNITEDDDDSLYSEIPSKMDVLLLDELNTLSGYDHSSSDRRTSLLYLQSAIAYKALAEDIYKLSILDNKNKDLSIDAYKEYTNLS